MPTAFRPEPSIPAQRCPGMAKCTVNAVPSIRRCTSLYLPFTRMPGESCCRRLRFLLLCLCDVFWALINSLVCWFAACPVPRLETFTRTNGPVTIHNHSRLSCLLDEEVGCAGEEQAPGIQTAGVELTQLGVALRQCAVRLPVRLLEHVLHQSHLGTQLLNNQPAPVIPFTYITCSFSKEQPTSTSYDFYLHHV